MNHETVLIVIAFVVIGVILYENYCLRRKLAESVYQSEVMKDYSHIIQSYLEKRELPVLVDYFRKNQPVTVFGLNSFAKVMIKDLTTQGVEVRGIIDNFNKRQFMGMETETLDEFLQHADVANTLIVICVLRLQAYDIKQKLLDFVSWENVKTIEEIVVDEAYLLDRTGHIQS